MHYNTMQIRRKKIDYLGTETDFCLLCGTANISKISDLMLVLVEAHLLDISLNLEAYH